MLNLHKGDDLACVRSKKISYWQLITVFLARSRCLTISRSIGLWAGLSKAD